MQTLQAADDAAHVRPVAGRCEVTASTAFQPRYSWSWLRSSASRCSAPFCSWDCQFLHLVFCLHACCHASYFWDCDCSPSFLPGSRKFFSPRRTRMCAQPGMLPGALLHPTPVPPMRMGPISALGGTTQACCGLAPRRLCCACRALEVANVRAAVRSRGHLPPGVHTSLAPVPGCVCAWAYVQPRAALSDLAAWLQGAVFCAVQCTSQQWVLYLGEWGHGMDTPWHNLGAWQSWPVCQASSFFAASFQQGWHVTRASAGLLGVY